MRDEFLNFSPPSIGEEEIGEVADTLRSDWITTGPKTKRFETDFAACVQAPGALALNSCTAGLHTALVVAGVGPGDEVIVTPLTFAATVNCIEHVGARPVLVDVSPDTLNIDPERVAEAIGPRTKAIMPVHLAGHPADMDPIRELAKRRDLLIVEDAAHALPAKYRGRPIGSWENPAAFSFYASKNITTGEGGMLTGTPAFLDEAKVVGLHGMSRDAWKRYEKGGAWYYEVVMPGFKYNMSDIQAAIGLWQLRKLEGFQRRRREIVAAYSAAFRDNDALEIPVARPEVEHAWHLYILRLCLKALRIDRNGFIEELRARNIGVSVHFIPIHLHPFYRDKYRYQPEDFPVAFGNYLRMISLPVYPRMTNRDVEDVVEAVIDIVKTFKR
ncbi:MAG: DegT/DnrJ/EryC1/StrS family aminotransferase [Deltaproteobacteria bacterium]|nr:DegT/DnrJ/EryC1/StrS family aminotransferase [Deltaproteobacteria bacterium]